MAPRPAVTVMELQRGVRQPHTHTQMVAICVWPLRHTSMIARHVESGKCMYGLGGLDDRGEVPCWVQQRVRSTQHMHGSCGALEEEGHAKE